MSDPSTLRLAATSIPIRDGADGLEFLMVRRAEQLSFGGMWTFPGGSLDPEDGPVPELDEATIDYADASLVSTARVAAQRETREETALAVDPTSLAWLSHWVPPVGGLAPKRFATWFFLAPGTTGDLVLDEAENTDAAWITAQGALDRHGADDFPLAPPTWTTLWDATDHGTVADILSAADHGPAWFHTKLSPTDAGAVLMWSGDAGYESSDPTVDGPRNRIIAARDGSMRRER